MKPHAVILQKLRAKVVAELADAKEAIQLRASYGGPDPDLIGTAKLLSKTDTLRQVLAWIDKPNN